MLELVSLDLLLDNRAKDFISAGLRFTPCVQYRRIVHGRRARSLHASRAMTLQGAM